MYTWLCTTCASVLLPAGFCDFEMDFCGWVNNPPAEYGVDWDWLSGDSNGDFIPKRDHSTGTSLGKLSYTYFNYQHCFSGRYFADRKMQSTTVML